MNISTQTLLRSIVANHTQNNGQLFMEVEAPIGAFGKMQYINETLLLSALQKAAHDCDLRYQQLAAEAAGYDEDDGIHAEVLAYEGLRVQIEGEIQKIICALLGLDNIEDRFLVKLGNECDTDGAAVCITQVAGVHRGHIMAYTGHGYYGQIGAWLSEDRPIGPTDRPNCAYCTNSSFVLYDSPLSFGQRLPPWFKGREDGFKLIADHLSDTQAMEIIKQNIA